MLHPGSVVYDAAGKSYTVAGSGENMWAARDAFHFAWKKASGDLALAADVAFLGAGNDPHRKACLMIRQSLDADSAYVDVALHGDGLTSLQFREARGGRHARGAGERLGPRAAPPGEAGQVRHDVPGGRGRASRRFSGAAVRIAFQEPFYVGIGVCAHNKDVTETAVFSNVELADARRRPDGRGRRSTAPWRRRRSPRPTAASSTSRPSRIEAPNWLRDGQTLIYNSGGPDLPRSRPPGGRREAIDTGFAIAVQQRPRGLARRHAAGHQRPVAGRRGKSLIYTLPVAGGTPKLVTPTGPSYWHGWSPDGKTLAFCGRARRRVRHLHDPRRGRRGDPPDDRQGPGRRPGVLARRQVHLLQLRPHRHDAGLADEARRQRAGAGDRRRVQQLVPPPLARRPVAGLPLLREGRDGPPREQGRDPPADDPASARRSTSSAEFFGGQGTINVPCWSPDGKKIAFVTYQADRRAAADEPPPP